MSDLKNSMKINPKPNTTENPEGSEGNPGKDEKDLNSDSGKEKEPSEIDSSDPRSDSEQTYFLTEIIKKLRGGEKGKNDIIKEIERKLGKQKNKEKRRVNFSPDNRQSSTTDSSEMSSESSEFTTTTESSSDS